MASSWDSLRQQDKPWGHGYKRPGWLTRELSHSGVMRKDLASLRSCRLQGCLSSLKSRPEQENLHLLPSVARASPHFSPPPPEAGGWGQRWH